MIIDEMRVADQETWYNGVLEAIETKEVNTSKMDLDMVLSTY